MIESERMVKALQAASYPHLKKSKQKRLWDSVSKPARRATAAVLRSANELADFVQQETGWSPRDEQRQDTRQ